MPDREVETIRDLIYYQYAKIIARSSFSLPDGKLAKGKHYGFIKKTFRELKTGEKNWSEILREDRQMVEAEKKCVYCGQDRNLSWEHLVPQSICIVERCPRCERILGIHNQVWACRSCNSSKGTLGLYEFFGAIHSDDSKFYDLIPSLLEKKYLKTIYHCHVCAETLDSGDIDGDGDLTVSDIDAILHR